MAVAQVLFGFAQLINAEDRVRWFPAQVAWALCILLVTATWWWLEFSWSRDEELRYVVYLFLAAKPCVLYSVAVLLFPRVQDTGVIDLERHYWRRSKWVIGLSVGFVAMEVLDSGVRVGSLLSMDPVYLVSVLVVLSLLASGVFVRKKFYHLLLVGLILAVMLFSLFEEGQI